MHYNGDVEAGAGRDCSWLRRRGRLEGFLMIPFAVTEMQNTEAALLRRSMEEAVRSEL
jgi:hypothetical protein